MEPTSFDVGDEDEDDGTMPENVAAMEPTSFDVGDAAMTGDKVATEELPQWSRRPSTSVTAAPDRARGHRVGAAMEPTSFDVGDRSQVLPVLTCEDAKTCER